MNRQWILLPALLIIGIFIGYNVVPKIERTGKNYEQHSCKRDHTLINPELDCINTDERFLLISESERDVIKYIGHLIENNELSRVSVFYRDLNTGRWFGINENESFAPASLLKLPLAIAYYKLSEINPSILTQQVTVPKAHTSLADIQSVRPNSEIKEGEILSVEKLIELMLVNSDNDIFAFLANGIDQEFYNKVNLDLGVHFPTSGGIEQNFVSTKVYAAMLRSLYNSTYLSPENSERILTILSKTKFDDGISSGVPKFITVSNKFGERGIKYEGKASEQMISQFHDCGIIYAKDAPYILCVMTEGNDQKPLLKAISNLSQIVYNKSSSMVPREQ